MDKNGALKLCRVLMMKTTVNGCTVGEASASAAKLAELMRNHGFSIGELMGANDVPSKPMAARPQPSQPRSAAPPIHKAAWYERLGMTKRELWCRIVFVFVVLCIVRHWLFSD